MIKISYEGYSQFWCSKGHCWTLDCNELPNLNYQEPKKQKCSLCGEEEVFENMVDITNGSFDDEGIRIDGYIKPLIKVKRSGICSACNKEHVCEVTYQIPEKKEEDLK